MWAATDIKSIQKVGTIADSARWLAKAENVPEEIAHCLQLIQVISRDTKYLVELRNEHYSVLQSTPREFNRIDEILNSAAESLGDVDRLLERYRDQVDNKGSTPSLPVLWLLSDSETFSIRARNLQTQHQTILSEINHLRSYRLISPVMQMASQTVQHQFENLDLLKSLMGGKGPVQGWCSQSQLKVVTLTHCTRYDPKEDGATASSSHSAVNNPAVQRVGSSSPTATPPTVQRCRR